jgi:hypothetical protein
MLKKEQDKPEKRTSNQKKKQGFEQLPKTGRG